MFRDQSVESTFAGGAFMKVFNAFYYSFSPTVASFITEYPAFQGVARSLLYPMIAALHSASAVFSSLALTPEIAVAASGLVASALIGMVYLAPLAVAALFCSKRLKTRH